MRSNGLPALKDLPITFKRRAATTDFTKLVGKETARAKHSPFEYVSADGRWIIRSVHHRGHGTSNSGRVRWHAVHDGNYFAVGYGGHGYTLSLEDAIDEIHRKIGRGLRDGFEVLAKMRQAGEAAARADELRAANLVKARDLLGRLYGADPTRMVEALAHHVNLDALAKAVESASTLEGEVP